MVRGTDTLSCGSLIIHELCSAESYMRRVVRPLETLLTSHKRIVIKDSAVSPGSAIAPACL